MSDFKKLIEDFPVLNKNDGFTFLDSAASSQKPQQVIDRIRCFYECEYANIHRGIYKLSEAATAEYERTRAIVAKFLHVPDPREIIFTKGTTESINLIALTWGRKFLDSKSEVVLTVSEHHANIVPWQMLRDELGFKIRYIPIDSNNRLDMEVAGKVINKNTKLVAFSHISNVLGTIHPVKQLISLAKSVGAATLVDGAQGVPHVEVDLKELDCDFYVFSGHKIFGPTGVGVLYGKQHILEEIPPFHGGGDMIDTVSLEGSTWADIPHKFEAGTPNIVGVVGLGEAIRYLMKIDRASALEHDISLGGFCLDELARFGDIKTFIGDRKNWVGIVTFEHAKIHAHDLAALCDREDVAVRAGHHCAMPLLKELGAVSTLRVSPYMYNTKQDIENVIAIIEKAEKLFL